MVSNLTLTRRIFKFKSYPEIRCIHPLHDETTNGTGAAIQEGAFLLEKVNFKSGDITLDIGCNVGLLTCLIAKLYPYTYIHAIDASPISCLCARMNVVENRLLNVNIINKAVGTNNQKSVNYVSNSKEITCLINKNYTTNNIVSTTHQDSYLCDQISIEEIFDSLILGIDKVKYCKIDIEGGEIEMIPYLLNKRPDIIERIENFHLEVHNVNNSQQEFVDNILPKLGSKLLK